MVSFYTLCNGEAVNGTWLYQEANVHTVEYRYSEKDIHRFRPLCSFYLWIKIEYNHHALLLYICLTRNYIKLRILNLENTIKRLSCIVTLQWSKCISTDGNSEYFPFSTPQEQSIVYRVISLTSYVSIAICLPLRLRQTQFSYTQHGQHLIRLSSLFPTLDLS